jgi:hypothetical protein
MYTLAPSVLCALVTVAAPLSPIIASVGTYGAPRSLRQPLHIIGHNADDMYRLGTGYFGDESFVAGFATLHAGNVRWPGGTSSNFFDWKAGAFFSQQELAKRNLTNPCGAGDAARQLLLEHLQQALHAGGQFLLPLPIHPSHPSHAKVHPRGLTNSALNFFFFSLFARSPALCCQSVIEKITKNVAGDWTELGRGAAPLFCLNILSSNLTYQMEMLEHAESLGMPIKYAELGNELYIPFDNYVTGFPTVEDYAATAVAWANALKLRWPELTLGVPASGSSAKGCKGKPSGSPGCEQRRLTWNTRLSAALRGANSIQAATLHQYPGTTLPPLSGTNTTKCPSWGYADAAQQAHELAQLRDRSPAGAVARMLGVPFEYAQPELAAAAAELPTVASIWVSEYNIRDTCGVAQYSWAAALFTTTLSMLYLHTPRVELLTVWSLGGAAGYTSLFTSNSSFAGLCCNLSVSTVANGQTAQGLLLSELSSAVGNGSLLSPIMFSPSPTLSRGVGNNTAYPALLGQQFTPKPSTRLKPSVGSDHGPVRTSSDRQGTYSDYDDGKSSKMVAAKGMFLLNLSPDSHEVDISAVVNSHNHRHVHSSSSKVPTRPVGIVAEAARWSCVVRQWSAPPELHYNGGMLMGQVNATVGWLGTAMTLVARPYSATSVTCSATDASAVALRSGAAGGLVAA